MKNVIISVEEAKAWKDMSDELQDHALWGTTPLKDHAPEPKRYWAKVMADGKVISAFVDKDTMKAYRSKDYECTDEKITNFLFIRWMRMHEI